MDQQAWADYLSELQDMSAQELAFEVETWQAILADDEATNVQRYRAQDAITLIMTLDSRVEAVLA